MSETVCLSAELDNNVLGTVSDALWRNNNMIFGYLDPGSGSLILQAVIGGLAGLGVAIKAFRARHGLGKSKTAAGPEQEDAVEETTLPAES